MPSSVLTCDLFQVFDCWFESGSMPYAYLHYPFENVGLFEKNFPGHFVAEGLDQTRGWSVSCSISSNSLANSHSGFIYMYPFFVAVFFSFVSCNFILHISFLLFAG